MLGSELSRTGTERRLKVRGATSPRIVHPAKGVSNGAVL